MPKRPTSVSLAHQLQKKLAGDLFNYVWTLLELPGRSERESDRRIHSAHASRFFWEEIGGPVQHARGEWQISRVYATVERAEPAQYHARRCLEICEEHGIGGFDLADAYEAFARAHALAGDVANAARYERQAHEAAVRIADDEDREIVLRDLETLPL